ncbi:hypothetical protein FACS189467_6070 [Bacteroidia bacterium]|nr:hypothetical protein FACS189467_6070 [Bacteroidia bacterium]
MKYNYSMKKLIYIIAVLVVSIAIGSCKDDDKINVPAGIIPANINIAPLNATYGDMITVTGTNIDQIRAIRIDGRPDFVVCIVEQDSFITQSASSLTFRLPIDAPNGKVFLVNANDATENLETELEFTVTLPVVSAITPSRETGVKGGDTVTIIGTNLNLIRNVEIGGMRLTLPDSAVNEEYTVMNAICPAEITGGAVVIIAYNGYKQQLEGGQFDNTAAKLKITKVEPEDVDPMALTDSTIIVTGVRLDAVTQAFIDDYELRVGETAIVSGDEMTLALYYDDAVTEGTLKLLTSNGTEVPHLNPIVFQAISPTITNVQENVLVGGLFTIKGTYLKSVEKLIFDGRAIFSNKFDYVDHYTIRLHLPPENYAIGTTSNNITLQSRYDSKREDFVVLQTAPLTVWDTIPSKYMLMNFDNKLADADDAGGTAAEPIERVESSEDGTKFAEIKDSIHQPNYLGTSHYIRTTKLKAAFLADFAFTTNATLEFALAVDSVSPSTYLRWRIVANDRAFNYEWDLSSYQAGTNGWVKITIPLANFVRSGSNPITENDFKKADIYDMYVDLFPQSGNGNIHIRIDNVAFVE